MHRVRALLQQLTASSASALTGSVRPAPAHASSTDTGDATAAPAAGYSPVAAASAPTSGLPPVRYGVQWRNWAHTFSCAPAAVFAPSTVGHVRAVLRWASHNGMTVKAVGAGHSPGPIPLTDAAEGGRAGGVMVDCKGLNQLLHVDRSAQRVTVQAGMLVSELNTVLAANGMALSNLGSISDQTIGGAISTATHGTGARFGSLSSFVTALQVMDADGKLHDADDNTNVDLFNAARCGLVSGVSLRRFRTLSSADVLRVVRVCARRRARSAF